MAKRLYEVVVVISSYILLKDILVYKGPFKCLRKIQMYDVIITVIKSHSFCKNNIAVQNIPAAINTQ